MKTRHNKNIKKLSTAILRGARIAKENGIKHSRGRLAELDAKGNIKCACALGMAHIGVFGIQATKDLQEYDEDGYSALEEKFPETDAVNMCVNEKAKIVDYPTGFTCNSTRVQDAVISLNDSDNKKPEQIAKLLQECKL